LEGNLERGQPTAYSGRKEEGDNLILLRGIPQKWLQPDNPIKIGPIRTRFGALEIVVESAAETVEVSSKARWHAPPAGLFIQLPGTVPVRWDEPGNRNGRRSLSR
jgi:hypothetical protein